MSDTKYELLKKRIETIEQENKELRALIEEQIFHFMSMFKREGHHGMHLIAENLKKRVLKNWGAETIDSTVLCLFLESDDLAKLKHASFYEILSNESDYDFNIYDNARERNIMEWHNKIESLDKATTDQLFSEIFKQEIKLIKEEGVPPKLMMDELEKALKHIENDGKSIFEWENFTILSLIPSSKSGTISGTFSETMWQVYKTFNKFKKNDKAQLIGIIQESIDDLRGLM